MFPVELLLLRLWCSCTAQSCYLFGKDEHAVHLQDWSLDIRVDKSFVFRWRGRPGCDTDTSKFLFQVPSLSEKINPVFWKTLLKAKEYSSWHERFKETKISSVGNQQDLQYQSGRLDFFPICLFRNAACFKGVGDGLLHHIAWPDIFKNYNIPRHSYRSSPKTKKFPAGSPVLLVEVWFRISHGETRRKQR